MKVLLAADADARAARIASRSGEQLSVLTPTAGSVSTSPCRGGWLPVVDVIFSGASCSVLGILVDVAVIRCDHIRSSQGRSGHVVLMLGVDSLTGMGSQVSLTMITASNRCNCVSVEQTRFLRSAPRSCLNDVGHGAKKHCPRQCRGQFAPWLQSDTNHGREAETPLHLWNHASLSKVPKLLCLQFVSFFWTRNEEPWTGSCQEHHNCQLS